MAESSAGAVYLDLIIRDTIQQQLDKIVGRAGDAAEKSLGDSGKHAGRAFAGGFDRGVASAELAVTRLKKQASDLYEQLDGIAEKKLRAVAGIFPDAGSQNAYVEKALAGDKAYQKLFAQAERADRQIEAAQDRLSVAVQAAQDKQARAAEAAAEQAASASEKAAARTRRAAQRAVDTVRQAASAGLSAVKNAAGSITGLARKAASGLQKSWQTAAGKIGKIFTTIGRTARRVFVLGSILAFFRGMKSAMQGAVQQNDQLSASLARIKGSFATAFSAIFTAAMPALQALMNGLAALTAKLASFVTALFGTTVSKAGAAAKKLTAVGSSAGKAAKKMQGALAGFDELNVLQQQEDEDSGSGAGSGYDFGGMADAEASSFGEQLRAAFLAQDWDGIGTLLGEKFNSLVDGFDAAKWGARFGRAVQAGIAILWQFVETADWNELGQKIGEFCTMALAQVDGWKFGQLLTAPWKIGLETLQGFIETFDFALLGRQLSNGIKGALEQMTDAVQAVDWYGFGKKVEASLCAIDWTGIFTSVAEFAGSCLGAVYAFFWSRFEDTWNGLKDYFNGFIEEAGGNIARGLLNGIINALVNVKQWIVDHIFTPFMDGFQKAFGIHSPSTVMEEMGQYLVAGLLGGLTERWQQISGFFSGALEGVKTLFSDAWSSLQQITDDLWNNGIFDTIKGAVNSIIGLINGLAQAAANGVNAVVDALNELSFDVPDWVPVLGGKTFGFDLPHVTAPQIPMLANGGVIEQPTLAMLGEYQGAGYDPEIAAPESKLRGIFAEGLTPLLELLRELLELVRDGGDQEIVIRFAASGGLEQLVRLLLPYIDKEQTRVGAKLVTGGVY